MPVTLLAVDDSVTMRKVLEMTFAGEDFKVVTADTADAAVAAARANRPAIVLADATLEGKSGYDLCQAIKRDTPNVPVLVLSSKLHPYDAAKGQAARVDDHLDKPFDTQQLIDKVRALLSAPSGVRTPAPGAAAQRPAAVPPVRPPQPSAPAIGIRAPIAAPAAVRVAPAPAPATVNLRATHEFPPRAAPQVTPAAPPGVRPAAPSPVTRPAAPLVPQRPAPAPAAPATAAAALGAIDADLGKKLAALGLTKDQVEGVLVLSHEIVERVVWEVVPALAETMIKEEIQRLTAE